MPACKQSRRSLAVNWAMALPLIESVSMTRVSLSSALPLSVSCASGRRTCRSAPAMALPLKERAFVLAERGLEDQDSGVRPGAGRA